jgi:hypothetical protein
MGITLTNLVITVAAQNDICPKGKTYPKKQISINKTKIINPVVQTFFI